MGSSDRLFNRHRTIHQILGGGLVADVMLWRRKNLTVGILVLAWGAWMMFEMFDYTLLSYLSNVVLLLFTILFFWAKSAAILSRPAPPLPHFHISEETAKEVCTFIHDRVNFILSVAEDIALGRDSRMFVKLAICLLASSILGSLTNLLTLCCTCLFLVLTIPALYERFEDHIDTNAMMGYRKMEQICLKMDEDFVIIHKWIHNWILEMKKLS